MNVHFGRLCAQNVLYSAQNTVIIFVRCESNDFLIEGKL